MAKAAFIVVLASTMPRGNFPRNSGASAFFHLSELGEDFVVLLLSEAGETVANGGVHPEADGEAAHLVGDLPDHVAGEVDGEDTEAEDLDGDILFGWSACKVPAFGWSQSKSA
jgi:hypothetical protein